MGCIGILPYYFINPTKIFGRQKIKFHSIKTQKVIIQTLNAMTEIPGGGENIGHPEYRPSENGPQMKLFVVSLK